MIYPLIISPEFLIKIKDDEKLLNKFSKFVDRFREYWNDIFILIDDEKNTFTNKYKEIRENYGHESYDFNILCDLLINSNKSKKINIDKKFESEKEILDYLKKKRITNLINFTDYFENDYLTLKKTLHKVLLSSLNDDEAIEKIISVTRFSKNIVLIDPNIADALTNFSLIYAREHKNDCTQIKSRINDKHNDFIYSLNKIIKAIYNSNIFSDKSKIRIQIRTTLNHTKLNHFKFSIIEEHKKWRIFDKAKENGSKKFFWPLKKYKKTNQTKEYETLDDGIKLYSLIDKEINENDDEYYEKIKSTNILKVESRDKLNERIKSFELIGNFIKKNIEACTSNILSDLKPSVIINEHYKNLDKDEKTEQDIYFRHILAVDLRSSLELRKRLDIFCSKKKKLKNINSWYLNLEVGPDEKGSAFNIFKHKTYEPEKIIFN